MERQNEKEMKFICKKCGSTDYKIIEKSNGRGIATGLYCAKCGQWQKWLNKQEKVLFADDINSTAEVDVLKRDVENLTRTLEEVNEEYRALQAENVALQRRKSNNSYGGRQNRYRTYTALGDLCGGRKV